MSLLGNGEGKSLVLLFVLFQSEKQEMASLNPERKNRLFFYSNNWSTVPPINKLVNWFLLDSIITGQLR